MNEKQKYLRIKSNAWDMALLVQNTAESNLAAHHTIGDTLKLFVDGDIDGLELDELTFIVTVEEATQDEIDNWTEWDG